MSYPKSIAQKKKIFSQDKSLQFMDYRDRSRLTFPPFQMSSLKAQKGDTVTQLRSFTVLSRPFIQGLQGNELTRSAYSQPAMISHGRRTSTTSLTRVSRPSPHLSFCPSTRVCPSLKGPSSQTEDTNQVHHHHHHR